MKMDSTARSVVKRRLGPSPLFWRPYMIYNYVKDKLSFSFATFLRSSEDIVLHSQPCADTYVLLPSEMFGRNGNI